MIDLGSALAVGLAGFIAGMSYVSRTSLASLSEAAHAGAINVDGRAYVLMPLHPDPLPAKPGDLKVIQGGKPEDAA